MPIRSIQINESGKVVSCDRICTVSKAVTSLAAFNCPVATNKMRGRGGKRSTSESDVADILNNGLNVLSQKIVIGQLVRVSQDHLTISLPRLMSNVLSEPYLPFRQKTSGNVSEPVSRKNLSIFRR